MFIAIRTMVSYLAARINNDIRNERGATMVEYGLIVAFIAIVVAVGAATLGGEVLDLFNDTATSVDKAPPAAQPVDAT